MDENKESSDVKAPSATTHTITTTSEIVEKATEATVETVTEKVTEKVTATVTSTATATSTSTEKITTEAAIAVATATATAAGKKSELDSVPPIPSQRVQHGHNVRVKAEYILTKAHPTLAHQQPQPQRNPIADCTDQDDGSRSHPNHKQQQNRSKQNAKKMRRKRPRDDKSSPLDKVCRSILEGTACPVGEDNCKYNHNLKELLRLRPDDIKEIDAGCPFYDLTGRCPYGLTCRVGSSHLNLETGASIKKNESELANPPPPQTMNSVSRDLQTKLRKKKYNFICKRHFNKQVKNTPAPTSTEALTSTPITAATTTTNDTTVDLAPYPLKTRKLIDFSNKVYVAPLTTVGNLPFRRILKRCGADITCGEMALVKNLLEGKTREWALLKRHPDEDVFGIQLAAGQADMYTRISEVIENEGISVDFIDLNLGCPLDAICQQGAGASLMLREKKLKDTLSGMTKVLSCPVTVKIRTGWDSNKPFAHKLVPKIQQWGFEGVSAVMLHGRSRLQRYHKIADWDYIQQVAKAQNPDLPKIPLIGNGDIFSYTDYERNVLANDGLSTTAMLGRGALIKPWLPTEIKEKRHWDISATERFDLLKEFVRFGLEHWGSDQVGLNSTRRFLLEWLSFLYRYVPVGLLEVLPQNLNERPPNHMCGRSDLETLMLSKNCADWIKISEMLLGPTPEGFHFDPKHKANGYLVPT